MGRKARATGGGRLEALPATFTYAQARRNGVTDRMLYRWRDTGLVEAIGRGLYRRAGLGSTADIDLLEIAGRSPRATLCLTTALAKHGLTDEIPATIDVAIPRGDHRPVTIAPVTWHVFDRRTFDLGRTEWQLDESTAIGLYGPERSIIDAIRLRHREGNELGYVALKRWLALPGSSPAKLLALGRAFPQAVKAVRSAIEILL